MTQSAISAAPTPLCELPAAALRVVAPFAGSDDGLDHVSIVPGDDDGQVVVTAASGTIGAEIVCEGQATAAIMLPVRALRMALCRLKAEHASVVLSDDHLATLRLYEQSATLAVSMPLADAERPVRLPVFPAGEQVADLRLNGAVLAKASAKLAAFGVLTVRTFELGWLLSGEADGLQLRCVIAGVRRDE
ncbi:MAG: hypothetical protein ACKO5F_04210 [Synechococcus sp.]